MMDWHCAKSKYQEFFKKRTSSHIRCTSGRTIYFNNLVIQRRSPSFKSYSPENIEKIISIQVRSNDICEKIDVLCFQKLYVCKKIFTILLIVDELEMKTVGLLKYRKFLTKIYECNFSSREIDFQKYGNLRNTIRKYSVKTIWISSLNFFALRVFPKFTLRINARLTLFELSRWFFYARQ